jgi:hypothetical protein
MHCKAVGRGEQALIYLGRYLYRGVISEKNILSDSHGFITFRIKDNTGQEVIQRLPGAEFLWRLLLHVLPKRFRRVRDFGLLHGNVKRLILLVQLVLNVSTPCFTSRLLKSFQGSDSCFSSMMGLAEKLTLLTSL